MSKIKNALEEINNCEFCGGHGYVTWHSGREYEIQFCECNPNNLPDPKQP
jgi:hypothetical protein